MSPRSSVFPESLARVELSPRLFPLTTQALQTGVNDGVAPGFVAGVWIYSEPRIFFAGSAGNRRTIPSTLPMEWNTVFDLASVTKVFATASLVALLVDRRWLDWKTPVAAILPEFNDPRIQIRHLLSHTAGFPAWIPFWKKIQERFAPRPLESVSIPERQRAMRREVLAVAPEAAPGERVLYSDLSYLLLGFVVEELFKMPFDEAVRKELWSPMGIRGAYFKRVSRNIDGGRDESVAATENCSWRGGVVQGQVHDENCWSMGGYAGHAGSFGSVTELMQFSKKLMSGFLSAETLRAMWTRVAEPPGCERTLGWDTPSGELPSAGHLFSPRSVGHLGFTGTSLWIDPEAGIAAALLSNRVHPTRENTKIRQFRPLFHDSLRKDLAVYRTSAVN